MTPELTDQELIDDYERVERFLADPAVKRAFQSVRDKQFTAFSESKTPAEREGIFAQRKALDALSGELMGTMGAGQFAKAQRAQREAREEQERRMSDRRKR